MVGVVQWCDIAAGVWGYADGCAFVSWQKGKVAFRVLVDTYVTDDSGTGIVHQAPAFGEDDYRYQVYTTASLLSELESWNCRDPMKILHGRRAENQSLSLDIRGLNDSVRLSL